MAGKVLRRALMTAGLLFPMAALTPQTSTLMSAEPAGEQGAA
jgi:hypothetical protein